MIWPRRYALRDSHNSESEIGSVSFWLIIMKSSIEVAMNLLNLASERSNVLSLHGA